MDRKINRMLGIPLLVCFLIATITSCKQQVSDAEIKTSVDNTIAANTSLSGAKSDVKDGVVTLTGEVKDDAAKASTETVVKGVKGVKSVVNNLSVAPAPAPVIISNDSQLIEGVDSAIKAYPGVSATILNGVITLTGEIKRADLQNLIKTLNELKPKKIENNLTIK